MAQLVTKKEKYGVSVAARIDPQLAQEIAEKAEKLGVSMSKMIGMIISSGFHPNKPVQADYSDEVERLKSELEYADEVVQSKIDLYKKTAAEFISLIAQNPDNQMELIQQYNEVLNQLKQSHE